MRKVFRLICYLGLILCIGQALAGNEIYKKVDKEGRVIYSDSPIEGAEVIQIAPLKTYSAPALPDDQPSNASAATNTAEPHSYNVVIVSPEQNSFVPVGFTGVDVKVFTTPALYVTHRLQLKFDNQVYGDTQTANTFKIKELTNGSHTLQVLVVDVNNLSHIIGSSETITISTKRSFLNNPLLPSAPQMPKAPQAPQAPRAP